MGKTFKIQGQVIEYSDSQLEYHQWRSQYNYLATSCADRYLKEVYMSYEGLEKFAEKGLEDGFILIQKLLATTIQSLVNAKVYDIDENAFFTRYGEACFSDWVEAFGEIHDQFMEIVLKQEELDAYATQRRQNRGRWIGGGFGVAGAIKGAAMAGSINLAAGALHGTFNAIAKGVRNAGDASKKSKIYHSEQTKETLWRGIYASVFNMHDVLCTLCKVPMPTDGDLRTAKSLCNNLDKMKPDVIPENLARILALHPYNEGAYEFAIRAFGDPKSAIEEMAAFFGIDVTPFKQELIMGICNDFDLSSESSVMAAKSAVYDAFIRFNVGNFGIMQELDKKLEKLDIEARTVDGVLFATREQAKLASRQLQKAKEIVGRAEQANEKEVKDALLGLKMFRTPAGKKYIQQLEEIAAKLDLAARTREEAKRARRDAKAAAEKAAQQAAAVALQAPAVPSAVPATASFPVQAPPLPVPTAQWGAPAPIRAPWYYWKPFVVIFLLLFAPLAVILLWRSPLTRISGRMLWSLILALFWLLFGPVGIGIYLAGLAIALLIRKPARP